MRTMLLKSRTVLRSSQHPLRVFNYFADILLRSRCRKISSSKKPTSTHTGGAGLGDISGNKIVAVHLIAGLKFAWLSSTHCLLEFALFFSPAFAWTAPLRTLTKRFDRNCQKQHKTSSISQVFRKPPILRRLLLNLSTRAGLRASPHSKHDLEKGCPPLTAAQGSWTSQN